MGKKNEKTLADEAIEELKSPETFDLADVLNENVTYPTRDVLVGIDAEVAQAATELADEIADLITVADEFENDGTITGGDGAKYREQAEAKTAELQKLMDKLEETAIKFTLRGVPPKVWRTIDKYWRKEIPAKKSDDDVSTHEKNIARNEKVTIDVVRNAIVKMELSDGRISEGLPPFEQVEALYNTLMESEWEKLRATADQLTFANQLFDVTTTDADFLPKHSAGEATGDTSGK